jgi:hypothetical protein
VVFMSGAIYYVRDGCEWLLMRWSDPNFIVFSVRLSFNNVSAATFIPTPNHLFTPSLTQTPTHFPFTSQ